MSGRDLLYKPQVPVPLQDEGAEETKKAKGHKARDLGRVGDIVPTPVKRPAGAPATRTSKPAAYKAAYFNKDTSGVTEVNPNTSGARSLRGSTDATDLRTIVLPPPLGGIETPDPGVLSAASDLMGLEEVADHSLESLLTRQNAFAQGDGVTVEMLEFRMAQLEMMVEARRKALARVREAAPNSTASVTLTRAMETDGQGLNESHDLAEEGTRLIQDASGQAAGLHRRLAKVLGIKPKK